MGEQLMTSKDSIMSSMQARFEAPPVSRFKRLKPRRLYRRNIVATQIRSVMETQTMGTTSILTSLVSLMIALMLVAAVLAVAIPFFNGIATANTSSGTTVVISLILPIIGIGMIVVLFATMSRSLFGIGRY